MTNTILPSPKELRNFGIISSVIIISLFAFLFPWLTESKSSKWPWYLASILTALSLISPALLIHIYRPWMKFGAIAGWVNTRIILFILFFIVFFPIGIILKLFSKDPLQKKFDSEIDTYRTKSLTKNPEHMRRPY